MRGWRATMPRCARCGWRMVRTKSTTARSRGLSCANTPIWRSLRWRCWPAGPDRSAVVSEGVRKDDEFSGTKDVEERHRVDEAHLDAWMAGNVEGYHGPLTVLQFKGAQSEPDVPPQHACPSLGEAPQAVRKTATVGARGGSRVQGDLRAGQA